MQEVEMWSKQIYSINTRIKTKCMNGNPRGENVFIVTHL